MKLYILMQDFIESWTEELLYVKSKQKSIESIIKPME